MTLFMILLDKLSILTFDMPDDAVSLYHQMIRGKGSRPPSSHADNESQRLIEISPQQQRTIARTAGLGLNVNRS